MGDHKVVLIVFQCLLAHVLAEIWPPFGKLTPNNYIPPPVCKYEQEQVYEDILEEVCSTENVENCTKILVESETESVCEDISVCDENLCKVDPDDCEKCEGDDEDCQEVYQMVTKTECSYETKIDHKCYRMYEVSYIDECKESVESECKLFNNLLCNNVQRRKCTKVPKFPSKKCRVVPRVQEKCQDVVVRRPAGKCRVKCDQKSKEGKFCQNITKRVCKKVPSKTEKKVCEKVPNKTCKTEKVKRLKLIPRKICTELKLDPDSENSSKEQEEDS